MTTQCDRKPRGASWKPKPLISPFGKTGFSKVWTSPLAMFVHEERPLVREDVDVHRAHDGARGVAADGGVQRGERHLGLQERLDGAEDARQVIDDRLVVGGHRGQHAREWPNLGWVPRVRG